MAVYQGTRIPRGHKPKNGQKTKLKVSPGAKQLSDERLQIGNPATQVGPAPAHRRLYERDYLKTGTAPGDKDLVTAALGDPLKI